MNHPDKSIPTARFDQLGLAEPLLRALIQRKHHTPTLIQKEAIGPILAGRDLIACSETGSGKTAAYLLPILQQILTQTPADADQARSDGLPDVPRLVLVPTRELAGQIAQQFELYGQYVPARLALIHGGDPIATQIQRIASGIDLMIATPGRLLELMSQSRLGLKHLRMMVLDEADRLLDPTFRQETMRLIDKRPAGCQTLVCSASLPLDTLTLLHTKMNDPVSLVIQSQVAPVDRIQATLFRVPDAKDKPRLLAHWLTNHPTARVLVFVAKAHQADRLVTFLYRHDISAQALHGQMKPAHRHAAVERFASNDCPVMIATDLAARGMDWPFITHVIHVDLPDEPQTFMHRVGRTARGERTGETICIGCPSDEHRLVHLERLLGQSLIQGTDHPTYPVRPDKPKAGTAKKPMRSRYSKRSTDSDPPKQTKLYQRRGKQKKR